MKLVTLWSTLRLNVLLMENMWIIWTENIINTQYQVNDFSICKFYKKHLICFQPMLASKHFSFALKCYVFINYEPKNNS